MWKFVILLKYSSAEGRTGMRGGGDTEVGMQNQKETIIKNKKKILMNMKCIRRQIYLLIKLQALVLSVHKACPSEQ